MLTTLEVADLLGVSQPTVQNWIREGTLPAVSIGTKVTGEPSYRIAAKDMVKPLGSRCEICGARYTLPLTRGARPKRCQPCRVFRARLTSLNARRGGGLSVDDVLRQMERQAHQCYWCFEPIWDYAFQIDHYVPFSRGGQNTASNIVLTCDFCNTSKGNRDPEEFRVRSAIPWVMGVRHA